MLGFAATVSRLEAIARNCGMEEAILQPCLKAIEEQAAGMALLRELVPKTSARKPTKKTS